MKVFEIDITYRPNGEFKSLDKIEADDLLQLVAQFNFVILNLQRKIHLDEIQKLQLNNDDIPF